MDLKTYLSKERGAGTKLAAELEISASYLSQMANGQAPISPKRAVEIEQKTNGEVSRIESCEDAESIWPELARKRKAIKKN